MMKEYSFNPLSQVIDIKEGAVMNVELNGNRIAHSVYGTIYSLNGEPENKITVTAVGVNNCSQFKEEATSENGNFRIRGLQKYCAYRISIQYIEEMDNTLTKSIPEFQEIQVSTMNVVF